MFSASSLVFASRGRVWGHILVSFGDPVGTFSVFWRVLETGLNFHRFSSILEDSRGFRGQKVLGLWRPVARESWPLNKESCILPGAIHMVGLEYSRPGDLEAWVGLLDWSDWREVLEGLEAWQVLSHARRSERSADL